MAVFEQTRMTDGDQQQQSTPVKQQAMIHDGPFSPPPHSATAQHDASSTPLMPPSAKKAEIMKTPSFTTPATVTMMTPMSSEIMAPPSPVVPTELCISSSSGGVDSSTSSSDTTTGPSVRHQARTARDPSPSGRCVLIYNNDDDDDDSPGELTPPPHEPQPIPAASAASTRTNSWGSRSNLSRRGSAASSSNNNNMLPPKQQQQQQQDPCGYHGRRKLRSRSRKFSRTSSFHESELQLTRSNSTHDSVVPPRKSRSSRLHHRSNSSDLSLSDNYPNDTDNEEDEQHHLYGSNNNINMFETESLSAGSQSPNQDKHWRRRRRPSKRTDPSSSSSSSSPESGDTCIKLPRFMTTTKCLVWLLCLFGLTSVSMIIITNHSLQAHDLASREKQDPVTVLFSPDKNIKKKKGGGGGKKVEQPKKKLLRGATTTTENKAVPKTGGGVNLIHIAQAPAEAEKKKKKQHLAPEDPSTNKDKSHHRNKKEATDDTKQKHRKEEEEKKKKNKDDKQQHNDDNKEDKKKTKKKDKKKDHHHHHDHAEEVKRAYIREKPGIIGMDAIPRVAVPPSIDAVSSKGDFESVDRGLFTVLRDGTTTDNGGGPTTKRVVTLDGSPVASPPTQPRLIEEYPADFTDNTQLYSILDSSDERVGKSMERRNPHVKEECVPMQEWQTTFHPSCNGMHEVDMPRMGDDHIEDDFKLFGMKGFWRNAWKFDSMGGHAGLGERDTVVLKTLKINHRFEDAFYEHNRIDAVVLERLTASPHVINVFGFCGHSVVTEYADGKRLGELADKKKNEPLARLSIARDIANGLADVHGIDGDGNATFVHLDINPANVVSVGGTLKLNDFNIGILRRWNTTSNEPCGIPAQYPNPQWRSPEEARNEQNLTEKVDVFSMGHILFRLICEHEPWHKWEPNGMPTKDVLNERVKRGDLPTIPDHILNSSDPEVVAIRENMLRCYTYDATKRPSAREIANSLQRALDKLQTAAARVE